MPTFDYERQLLARGFQRIAGIDEVGRGCWAGPVVAAAVMLGTRAHMQPEVMEGIDDSERLSPAQRDTLRARIEALALGIGVGIVPAFLIDQLGIVRATRLAMEQAVLQLPMLPDALLIDAMRLPAMPLPQHAIIGGDQLSYSIAAASIIAKTTRDRLMSGLERDDARYGFAAHKGYGTAQHRAALERWGPCAQHRRSFRPLWNKEFST